MPRFDTPVRVRFTHYRYRYCDPDGASCKAFLDGIVRAGILADDSTAHIDEIQHRQVKIPKSEKERTVCEIEPVRTKTSDMFGLGDK